MLDKLLHNKSPHPLTLQQFSKQKEFKTFSIVSTESFVFCFNFNCGKKFLNVFSCIL